MFEESVRFGLKLDHFLMMSEDRPRRRRSLQEYGRYVPQPQTSTGSPVLPVRRHAYIPKTPPSGVELFQRTSGSPVRKYSLEEVRVVESTDQVGLQFVPGRSGPAVYPVYSVPSPTLFSMKSPTVIQASGLRPVQEVQPFIAVQSQPIQMPMENVLYQPVSAGLPSGPGYSGQGGQFQYQQCQMQELEDYSDVQVIQDSVQDLQLTDGVYITEQECYKYSRSPQPGNSFPQSGVDQTQPVLPQRRRSHTVQPVQTVQLVHPVQRLSTSPGVMYGVQGQVIAPYGPIITQINQDCSIGDRVSANVAQNGESVVYETTTPRRKKSSVGIDGKKKKVSFEDEAPKHLKIIKVQKANSVDCSPVTGDLDNNDGVAGKDDAGKEDYEPYVGLRRASTGTKPKSALVKTRRTSEVKQRRNSVCPMTAYNLR